MTDESDYSAILNGFIKAGLKVGNDWEKHHSIRVTEKITFWFDDNQNLIRVERMLDPVKGIKRTLACKLAAESR